MKTLIVLVAFALIASLVLASDPDRLSSMAQQPPKGVDALRLAIRKLKVGMSKEETQRILNVGYIRGARDGGSFTLSMPFQRDYTLTVEFGDDQPGVSLTYAALKRGDRVIAELGK